ncbi:hypothetical protein BGZ94_004481 [Podila epigama]|nr:hypothetical protein BGZ94_004481 [Podila epigama]
MSKRGTTEHLRKEDYDNDRDDDGPDNGGGLGEFNRASSSEMAKRVIKAPRSRKLQGEELPKAPSPFAGAFNFTSNSTTPTTTFGGFGGEKASTTTSSDSAASSTTSFGGSSSITFGGFGQKAAPSFGGFGEKPASTQLSFGEKPALSFSGFGEKPVSTQPSFGDKGATPSFTGFGEKAASTQPSFGGSSTFSCSGFGAKAAEGSASKEVEKSDKQAQGSQDEAEEPQGSFKSTTTTSAFTFNNPTFNSTPFNAQSGSTIGSGKNDPSASFGKEPKEVTTTTTTTTTTTLSKDGTTKSASSVTPKGNNKLTVKSQLSELNEVFIKKITEAYDKESAINLSQIFQQYIDNRMAIKSVLSESSENDLPFPSSPKLSSSTTKEEAAKPASTGMFNFGVPFPAPATSSAPATSTSNTGTFGKPATGGFGGFGGFGSSSSGSFGSGVTSTKETSGAPKPAVSAWNFGVTATEATSSSTTSSAATSTSSPFSFTPTPFKLPSTSSATPTSAPFSFAPAKPFSFSVPSSSPAVAPTTSSVPAFAGFKIPAAPAETSKEDDNESDKMPDDTKSELQETREGEEDEKTVIDLRSKLYSIVNNEHKDLGVGQFRVNENTTTGKRRMIMRTAGTGMITLNSWVIQGLPPKRDKKTVTVFAFEEGKPKKFLVRVKEESDAINLVQELEAAQETKQD